jgi:hypothetical protein
MITEQQLKNFKGMRDYGKLEGIQDQLMNIFNELYDMEIDTQDAKKDIAYAIVEVSKIMKGLES